MLIREPFRERTNIRGAYIDERPKWPIKEGLKSYCGYRNGTLNFFHMPNNEIFCSGGIYESEREVFSAFVYWVLLYFGHQKYILKVTRFIMERTTYIGQIEKAIKKNGRGCIFSCSDFVSITNKTNIKKTLSRLESNGTIRRLIRGFYEYPEYSELLHEYSEPDINKIAEAIARNYGWTISPSDDAALNYLGLSTQVPNVFAFISDGPYKEYVYKSIKILFKHRMNKEISGMSKMSSIVISGLKALGKENVDDKAISQIRKRLNSKQKHYLLSEASNATSWVYETIKRICKET